MTKYLFTSLFALSLANTSLAQTCSPVAELNENFSTFESGTLPQNCWSSNEVRPRAYVAPKSHI
ncbi:MAG: hypothetical protein Q4C75_05940, partial [Bergeyella zoohelcum]|nr:hypothetical protein [Bergeyella zoohelcum]